jgi:2-amino-4-hydroxy-6-hydroxymethyldihydropteridine diphosphokinase
VTIVIGLGGNVGTHDDVLRRLQLARTALTVLGPTRYAPLYRSAPIGPVQAPFLNSAVSLRLDDVQPPELIATLQEIEHQLGRRRRDETRWGPRTLDLDVLVWDDRELRTPELEVPHPRLTERRFALEPLAELLGRDHLVAGHSLDHWLSRVRDQQVEHLATSW